MVVAEAQAIGVPVVTSRLVGATECLPPRVWRVAARPSRSGAARGSERWRCSPTRARGVRSRAPEPSTPPRTTIARTQSDGGDVRSLRNGGSGRR